MHESDRLKSQDAEESYIDEAAIGRQGGTLPKVRPAWSDIERHPVAEPLTAEMPQGVSL
jgi:hypothetical protein